MQRGFHPLTRIHGLAGAFAATGPFALFTTYFGRFIGGRS
jgi:hypothetical protein